MKIILSGYERTNKIIPAVSYLLSKYIPKEFDIQFVINEQSVGNWSSNMRAYLQSLSDEFIIMGDGDLLISHPMDMEVYKSLLERMGGDTVCARLCYSSFYKPEEFTLEGDIMTLTNTAPYSAVLQYCIWNREFLIDLLAKTTDPWNFESEGSNIINASGKKVIGTKRGALIYYELGALSHEKYLGKVRVDGVDQEDINTMIEKGYLQKEDLITDEKIGTFSEMKFAYRGEDDKRLIQFVAQENAYSLPDKMEGQIMVDVGANIGTATVLAGTRGATVYAIEPGLDNFKHLKKNVFLNKLETRVKCYNVGIGNPGKAKLYVSYERPDWSGIYAEMNDLNPDDFEMVDLVSLKSIFDENNIQKCDILKLDAEGAEYTIIKEIEDGLHKKIVSIACEIHDGIMSHEEVLKRLDPFYGIIAKRNEWEYILKHK